MASRASLSQDEFRPLTWTRPPFSRMTIQPESLRQHCPLDNGRLQQRAISPSNIGNLEVLPLEIIHAILQTLDLQSLTNLRAVSWRVRALVDSFPPYVVVVKHTSDTLRALLSTCMSVHFTAQDIFKALCAQSCCCGRCGPFLDLFTPRRRCLTCVINAQELLSIRASSAKRLFGLSAKEMRNLPTLLSLPGEYGESKKTYCQRRSLVRVTSASLVQTKRHDRLNGSFPPSKTGLQATATLRELLRRDGRGKNPHRFMPMIRFPSLDRKTDKLEWGVSCQGCHLRPGDMRLGDCSWKTAYSINEHRDHFKGVRCLNMGREWCHYTLFRLGRISAIPMRNPWGFSAP
jgi:F-box domain